MRQAKRLAETQTSPVSDDEREAKSAQFANMAAEHWKKETHSLRGRATKATGVATEAIDKLGKPGTLDYAERVSAKLREELREMHADLREARIVAKASLRREIMGHTAGLPNAERRAMVDEAAQQFVPPSELTKFGEAVETLETESARRAEAKIKTATAPVAKASGSKPKVDPSKSPSPSP